MLTNLLSIPTSQGGLTKFLARQFKKEFLFTLKYEDKKTNKHSQSL
jgi:hypothetical protein